VKHAPGEIHAGFIGRQDDEDEIRLLLVLSGEVEISRGHLERKLARTVGKTGTDAVGELVESVDTRKAGRRSHRRNRSGRYGGGDG
jgi:hypothetical protein